MDMVYNYFLMELNIQEIGNKIMHKDLVDQNLSMVHTMKVNFIKIKLYLVNYNITQDHILKVNLMVFMKFSKMENLSFEMEKFFLANGILMET